MHKALSKGELSVDILASLADYMGVTLKEYEIPVLPALKNIEKAETQDDTEPKGFNDIPEKWKCDIRIDEEYGTAMVRFLKDGQKLCTGRSYLYGTDDVGILQSISYAMHMCYKLIQQNQIEELHDRKTLMDDNGSAMLDDDPFKANERVVFKDWIKKYEKDNSIYGAFARYVSSNYKDFPSVGEKNMKTYLSGHKGSSHLSTFKTLFKQYMHWYRTN